MPPLLSALLCLALCACDGDAKRSGTTGKDWLSLERTREVGMHVLLNRYPEARIVSEQGEGRVWTYRFTTNGVMVPLALVVDRKEGKAKFEKAGR